MANFQTHIVVAAAVSMFVGTLLYGAHLISSTEALCYIFLGLLGGILPDIDSDQSIAIQIVFQMLSAVIAFSVMFAAVTSVGILYAMALWVLIYLGFRYGVLKFFSQVTVHRGMIHSLPTAVLFGLFTVILAGEFFHANLVAAWLAGSFIFMGFIIHLILDELYSVDLMGATLRKSFGTALTVFSFKEPFGYLALYMITFAVFYITPAPDAFINKYFTWETLHALVIHLFPV